MKTLFIILTFAIQSLVFCQSVVYPLQTGTRWQFSYPPFGDYIPYAPMNIIKDSTMGNGKIYSAILYNDSSYIEYQRENSDSVFEYDIYKEQESLLFRFNAQEKDTVSSIANGNDTTDVILIDTTIYQLFGRSRRIFRFLIDVRHYIDDERYITVADSFGVIGISISFGYYCNIQGAIINGQKYGTITTVFSSNSFAPNQFALFQNFPNPFNPVTKLRFELATSGHVELEIYNALGQKMITLCNRNLDVGEHTLTFDATNYPSGIYYYRLQSSNSFQIKKMILQK